MVNKLKYLAIVWAAVIFAYIFMGFTNDASTAITDTASSEMESQNLTGIYGVQEMVDSYDYWKWAIPAGVGIVLTAIVLREDITESISRRWSS